MVTVRADGAVSDNGNIIGNVEKRNRSWFANWRGRIVRPFPTRRSAIALIARLEREETAAAAGLADDVSQCGHCGGIGHITSLCRNTDPTFKVVVWFATGYGPQVVAQFASRSAADRRAAEYLGADARGVWIELPNGTQEVAR